jgi:hypothetical protein
MATAKVLLTYLGVFLLASSWSFAQTGGTGGRATLTRGSQDSGIGQSSAASAKVPPSLLSKNAQAQPGHAVNLRWTASVPVTNLQRDAITGYNVYRSKKPNVKCGPQNKIASLSEPATSFVDTHVESGQTYYYATTAVSADRKESVCSKETKVVVP